MAEIKKNIYWNEFIYYIFFDILNLRFYGYTKKLEFHTCMTLPIIKDVRNDTFKSSHYCEIIEILKIVINL